MSEHPLLDSLLTWIDAPDVSDIGWQELQRALFDEATAFPEPDLCHALPETQADLQHYSDHARGWQLIADYRLGNWLERRGWRHILDFDLRRGKEALNVDGARGTSFYINRYIKDTCNAIDDFFDSLGLEHITVRHIADQFTIWTPQAVNNVTSEELVDRINAMFIDRRVHALCRDETGVVLKVAEIKAVNHHHDRGIDQYQRRVSPSLRRQLVNRRVGRNGQIDGIAADQLEFLEILMLDYLEVHWILASSSPRHGLRIYRTHRAFIDGVVSRGRPIQIVKVMQAGIRKHLADHYGQAEIERFAKSVLERVMATLNETLAITADTHVLDIIGDSYICVDGEADTAAAVGALRRALRFSYSLERDQINLPVYGCACAMAVSTLTPGDIERSLRELDERCDRVHFDALRSHLLDRRLDEDERRFLRYYFSPDTSRGVVRQEKVGLSRARIDTLLNASSTDRHDTGGTRSTGSHTSQPTNETGS